MYYKNKTFNNSKVNKIFSYILCINTQKTELNSYIIRLTLSHALYIGDAIKKQKQRQERFSQSVSLLDTS